MRAGADGATPRKLSGKRTAPLGILERAARTMRAQPPKGPEIRNLKRTGKNSQAKGQKGDE